jgi:hypothetical protein
MPLPIVAPAPIVTAHAAILRDLFEHRCQLQHFQHSLPGLIVLDNTRLTNLPRCVLESAEKTNLSRFFSDAPWFHDRVNDRRVAYLLPQTKAVRRPKADALLRLEDTLGEHGGSLFDYVDRPYQPGDGTYPLAHHPGTSSSVRGPGRFPVDLRLSRRSEESTRWEACVQKHCPDRSIPTPSKERMRLHKEGDALVFAAPACQELQAQCRTKIALGMDRWEAARRHTGPLSVLVFESWSLAEALGSMARYAKKDWISVRKKTRNLATQSLVLKDGAGQRLPLAGPHLAVAALVPLRPPTAYRAVTIRDKPSWALTLAGRIGGLGKVRLVVSVATAALPGPSAVWVTHRVDWSAQRLIALSVQRWPRETLSQDGKGHLGWDEYRMRHAAASGTPWCLVFVAYALVPRDCRPSSLTKAS